MLKIAKIGMGEESGDFNGNISFFEDWICSRICVWVCKFVKKKRNVLIGYAFGYAI